MSEVGDGAVGNEGMNEMDSYIFLSRGYIREEDGIETYSSSKPLDGHSQSNWQHRDLRFGVVEDKLCFHTERDAVAQIDIHSCLQPPYIASA